MIAAATTATTAAGENGGAEGRARADQRREAAVGEKHDAAKIRIWTTATTARMRRRGDGAAGRTTATVTTMLGPTTAADWRRRRRQRGEDGLGRSRSARMRRRDDGDAGIRFDDDTTRRGLPADAMHAEVLVEGSEVERPRPRCQSTTVRRATGLPQTPSRGRGFSAAIPGSRRGEHGDGATTTRRRRCDDGGDGRG